MFNGTIESLTELAEELPVQRETRIATQLIEYERTLETATPDEALLHQAYQCFQQCLQEHALDRELTHLAVAFSYHLENWSDTAHMLTQYRKAHLPVYEEAWAWWHYVDMLALAGAASIATQEQHALLRWAREVLPPDHRLFSIADTTQALVWVNQRKEAEWFAHAQTTLAQTPVRPASRFDRFLTLRSMFIVTLRLQESGQAEHVLAHLEAVVMEDPMWERAAEVRLETAALQLALANTLQDRRLLCELGEQAKAHYFQLAAQWEHSTLLQRRCRRLLAHNFGAGLCDGRFIVQ